MHRAVKAKKPARGQVEVAEPVRRSDSMDLSTLRELGGELLEEASPQEPKKRSVAVRIAGREYRIRSDAKPAWLRHVADQVDAAMMLIRERTETVDTLEVAVLTALNLAREIVLLREQLALLRGGETAAEAGDFQAAEAQRLRTLIELAESALESADRGA